MEKEEKVVSQALDKCLECGSQNLIHDHDSGETICSNCGLVLRKQMIDKRPEWQAWTLEEKISKTRVGAPGFYSVHDRGLSTEIGSRNFGVSRDAFGRELPIATRTQMWRLRKWQIRSRVHAAVDRNLAQAMRELVRLSDKLYIPDHAKEIAAIIYRKVVEKGLVRGRSIIAMVPAALYVACRMTGISRTLQEISEVSAEINGVKVKGHKKDVARCYRFLLEELNLRMPAASPLMYISKITGMTGISGETQGLAAEILREAQTKRATSGKDPKGLAAAVLYIACLKSGDKDRVTQKDIAEAAGVTEVTVRNRYKHIKRELGLKLPER